jgi:hypothetical protein
MPFLRALVVVLVGLALPLGLALGVYAASSDSLAAEPVVAPTGEVGRPAERVPPPTTTTTTTNTTTTTGTETEDEDSSGRGRGRGRGGDDNSGQGSDSSGSGSGDDD